jgi:hypothetical protein
MYVSFRNDMEKPKLVVLGSSHATRLLSKIKENEVLSARFNVIGNTKPGTTWYTLNINYELLLDLTPSDVLIVQFLGNDLLKKHLLITQNPKKFHLTRFEPKSEAYITNVRTKLKELLSQVKARIIIIDDPIRHLSCCPEHAANCPDLLKFLRTKNKELKRFFSEYTVLDHRKLFTSKTYKQFDHLATYKSLFVDTVHLDLKYYAEWAESLAKMLTE